MGGDRAGGFDVEIAQGEFGQLLPDVAAIHDHPPWAREVRSSSAPISPARSRIASWMRNLTVPTGAFWMRAISEYWSPAYIRRTSASRLIGDSAPRAADTLRSSSLDSARRSGVSAPARNMSLK